jgi:hypothetical protein
MAATRFEGAGPVAKYWLAHCEGFAVRGGAQGFVEELIHDADPHETTRLVVRTGHRRRRVVSAGSVAAVVPAERLVVVERPRRVRRRIRRPPLPTPSLARLRPPARGARRAVVAFARRTAPLARPFAELLVQSLRLLGAELRASAALLLRKRSR